MNIFNEIYNFVSKIIDGISFYVKYVILICEDI
jgi:hypothetical protein